MFEIECTAHGVLLWDLNAADVIVVPDFIDNGAEFVDFNRCWRCQKVEVPREDDLGLCPPCVKVLGSL